MSSIDSAPALKQKIGLMVGRETERSCRSEQLILVELHIVRVHCDSKKKDNL